MDELLGVRINETRWQLLRSFIHESSLPDGYLDSGIPLHYDITDKVLDDYQYDITDFDLANYIHKLDIEELEYNETSSIIPVLADWLGWYISFKLNTTTLTELYEHDEIFCLYMNGQLVYSDRKFYKDYFEKMIPYVRWIPKEYCQDK